MPELPEVETIRSQLDRVMPFSIRRAEYSTVVDSILKTRAFSPRGKTIRAVKRKGKLLYFSLDNNFLIMSHLGMSGGWRLAKSKVGEKHTHVQFQGTGKNGTPLFLAYVDPRRFGKMHFLKEKAGEIYLQKLGVDIGSPEFTADYLWQVFKKYRNRQLKPFLLDQKYFAGCGNYIACEICARAGIRPTRRAAKITRMECDTIVQATAQVLGPILDSNGLTFSGGYADTTGQKGDGLSHLLVFWQKTCQLCHKTSVKKITLAQRGTFYCPHCQK